MNQLKTIIFIHNLNDRSGSPNVLLNVIKSLDDALVEKILFCSKSKDGFLNNAPAEKYFYFFKLSNNSFLTFFYYVCSQFFLFFGLLRFWNKDVTLYVNTMIPFAAGIFGFIFRKKVIYHLHETSIRPTLKSFLKFVIKISSSTIIHVSKYLRDRESIPSKDNIVLYNSISSSLFLAGSGSNYKHNSDSFNVLMVCSMKSYKGIFEFLKIASICEINKKIKFKLVLSANQEEIDNFFNDVNIGKNVSILPVQYDLKHIYEDTNLLLNLSKPEKWIETFGLTILEGMAFGIPAIVPQIGGPSELVKEKVNGYKINSSEVFEISKKISQLEQNRTLTKKLSDNCKLRINEFSTEKFKKEINSIIINRA